MPIGPNIAVIGAGNRLAALPVLATIFNMPPDAGDRITLYDTDSEMLDLFDRVARAFAAYNGIPGISIVATEDLDEAMAGADAIFVCLDVGRRAPELIDKLRGFSNRDTQVESLTRVEMLRDDLTSVSKNFDREKPQLIFNMVYSTELSGTLLDATAFHLDWPERVPEDMQFVFAHRALRVVRGDEPVFAPLQEYKDNPLATAIMDSRPAPQNRYDPGYLARKSYELLGS